MAKVFVVNHIAICVSLSKKIELFLVQTELEMLEAPVKLRYRNATTSQLIEILEPLDWVITVKVKMGANAVEEFVPFRHNILNNGQKKNVRAQDLQKNRKALKFQNK